AKRRNIELTAPFVPGMDSLAAIDLESIRQEVIALTRAEVAKDLVRILDVFPAVIVDEGPSAEADYTDERYWVKRTHVSTSDGDQDSQITLTTLAGDHVRYRHVTATNLAELATNTHHVAIGTFVWVVKVRDESDPPVERFLFTCTPEAIVIPVVAQGDLDDTADPPVFSAKLADDWTGASVSGDAFWVMLPYSTGDYPNVRTGDIIGVLPTATGTTLWLGSAGGGSGADVDVPYCAVTDTANAGIGFGMFWAGADVGDIPEGWEITAEGRFLVGYAASPDPCTNYDTLGNSGGYNWHGPSENNHCDHAEHCHCHCHCHCENQALTVQTTTVCGTGSTTVVCQVTINNPNTSNADSVATGTATCACSRCHVGGTGPSSNNVDNRPKYLVVAWIKRTG
ncbi:MAG TPA: hypothetical protein P5118_24245, partial [Planctomycetota bacterium]|nr:hypothetical protein [Planctomycetota bacterium]